MIRKTDKIFKRSTEIWERGYLNRERAHEIVRRETWWLLFIPVYSKETITSSTI